MSNNERFSKRLGYGAVEKEITTRDDAPEGLRGFLIQILYEIGYTPSKCRAIICRVLRVAPDRDNWSEFPNIDGEINDLVSSCEWYFVYDLIEAFAEKLYPTEKDKFESEINDYFKVNGIGWKLVNGRIEYRGEQAFEKTMKKVVSVLETAKLSTATTEIKEALTDLSRRPVPDITGAVQHSLASLECVTREATGDRNSTLGDLMKKFPGVIPPPLDQAVSKIWGFTSEQGRHLREGQAPLYEEAELVVQVTAAITTYLGKKLGGTEAATSEGDEGFPF